MFCTHCGNQLPDGTRFCVFCGTAQESEPVAAPAPVVEPPVAEEVQCPVQTSLAEDSFINAVAVEEATYETPFMATPDYTPPVRTPAPKKKKTGLIIAIVLILVLLAGAAAGVYFWLGYKNAADYESATAMLEAGDINGALTAFEDLGDYEDSEKMVKNLKKYQQALKKLDAHEYNEAREIFEGLGKFHDSKTYAESGVDYHMATYLKTCADKGDPAGLFLLPLGEAYADSDDEAVYANEMYFAAAEIFDSLGDYLDSADLASACRFGMAKIELEIWNNPEKALELQEKMNDEDAQKLQQLLEERSADATLLEDLQYAMQIWLDEDDVATIEDETRKAYEHLKAYEDVYFLDPRLEELYHEIMDALETQMDAIESGEDVADWVDLYQGMADMYKVCDKLYKEYGFLKGSSLEDMLIGVADIASKYPVIEKSLEKQLSSVSAPWDEEKEYYYAPYTNDTGYDFELYVVIDFYQGDDLKETGKQMTITVKNGETIQIPLVPQKMEIGEFDGWTATWEFSPI